MDYDVVVVGGGIGGLVSASLLSTFGMKVALFEKHDKPGGFASKFQRKGYEFEVAVHSIENDCPQNIRWRIFRFLGLQERVNFLPMENFYRLHGAKGQLSIPCSIERAKSLLKLKYPCQSVGIDTFFEKMIKCAEEFYQLQLLDYPMEYENPLFSIQYPTMHEMLNVPVSHFLSQIFSNPEMRWLMLSNIGFYHNDPSRYPAAFFLNNQYLYFKGGACYVEGGTQNLSDAFVEIIRSNGGEVFLKSEVEEVLYHDEKQITIQVKPRSSIKPSFEVRSRYCVINAPKPYALGQLLKQKVNRNIPFSTSATTLYLGLTSPFHQLYDVDFFNFFSETRLNSNKGTDNLSFSLVDPSTVDRTQFNKGKFTADIVFLDSFSKWKEFEENGIYEEMKFSTIERIISELKSICPSIEKYIDVFELGTPKTIVSFTNNSEGAAYGYDIASFEVSEALRHLSLQYRPEFDLNPRVLFASVWSSYSHGLTGASLSGFQAAKTILEREQVSFDII